MDLLDKWAEEAIAVEEREISKLEQKELVIEFTKPSKGLTLNLSLSTQSAFKELPFNYQKSFNYSSISIEAISSL